MVLFEKALFVFKKWILSLHNLITIFKRNYSDSKKCTRLTSKYKHFIPLFQNFKKYRDCLSNYQLRSNYITWNGLNANFKEIQITKVFQMLSKNLLLQNHLLLSEPAHVRKGCEGSSSRLSRHISRSANTYNISLGWSPKRFHPRSST